MRIVTDSTTTEMLKVVIKAETEDDARFLIEKKKRKRCATEPVLRVEKIEPEVELDEGCKRCGSPNHGPRECSVAGEDLHCSFCKRTGHIEPACFQAHPERAKSLKRAKQSPCIRCGSPNHVQRECNIAFQDLHCTFCEKVGHVESVCFQAERAKSQQQTKYASLNTCSRCGSLTHTFRECDTHFEDAHCGFYNKTGHIESACVKARLGSAKNKQQTEYTTQQREITLISVQDKERKSIRKTITEGDKNEREFVGTVSSRQVDYRKVKAERDDLKLETDSKISFLSRENAKLSTELDDLKQETDARISSLANTNAMLRSELDDARVAMQENVKLQSELDTTRNAMQDLQTRFDGNRVHFSLLLKSHELEMQKQEAKSAVLDENATSELPIAEIRQCEIREDDKKKRGVQEFLKAMQDENLKLAGDLDVLKQKADAQIQALASEKTSLQNELDATKKKLRSMQGDQRKLTAELAEQRQNADGQIQSLTTEKASLQNDLDATRKVLRQMQGDQRKSAVELAEQKRKADGLIQTLTDEKTSLQIEIVAAQKLTRSLQADTQRLVVEQAEQKQTWSKEKSSLQAELAAARTAVQAAKTNSDKKLAIVPSGKENVEKKLASLEDERNAAVAALAQQKALAIKLDTELAIALLKKENLEKKLDCLELERDNTRHDLDRQRTLLVEERHDNHNLSQTLTNLMCHNRKLECDLNLIQEEAAQDKRKLVQARNDLDGAKTDIGHLETELKCLRDERNRLENLKYDASVGPIRDGAPEEKRKSVQTHKEFAGRYFSPKVNQRTGTANDDEDPKSNNAKSHRYPPQNYRNSRS